MSKLPTQLKNQFQNDHRAEAQLHGQDDLLNRLYTDNKYMIRERNNGKMFHEYFEASQIPTQGIRLDRLPRVPCRRVKMNSPERKTAIFDMFKLQETWNAR